MKQKNQKQTLGKIGEDAAVTFLLSHGYRILQRNFRARYGEIDILCEKHHVLIAVEVKTRSTDEFGIPEESVTPRKLQEIQTALEYYCVVHSLETIPLQIDVVAIETNTQGNIKTIRHHENVTG